VLILSEEFATREEAPKREKQIKSLEREEHLGNIFRDVAPAMRACLTSVAFNSLFKTSTNKK